MDKILMHNMFFYGYHGVLDAERSIGQKFIVDVEIMFDSQNAGETDSVENTISYAEVYDDIKAKEVMVKVKKPEAPVKGIFDYFGIEIRRKK